MKIQLFSKIKQKDIILKKTYTNQDINIYQLNNDMIIQTPTLFIPFGINEYYKNKYLNLSICNQPKFINFIRRFDHSIKKQLPKDIEYTKSIYHYKNQKMYLFKTKLPNQNKFLQIYDKNKRQLELEDIISNSFGILLIQPTTINIYKKKAKCIWYVLQIKLFLPFKNIQKCLIFDSDSDCENSYNSDELGDPDIKQLCCPNCNYLFKEKKKKKKEISSEYNKFIKMIRCGVPRICVEHKMKLSGLNSNLLDNIINNKNFKNTFLENNLSSLHHELLKGKKLRKVTKKQKKRIYLPKNKTNIIFLLY